MVESSYLKHKCIYVASIEKQVLTTYINFSRSFLRTTAIIGGQIVNCSFPAKVYSHGLIPNNNNNIDNNIDNNVELKPSRE